MGNRIATFSPKTSCPTGLDPKPLAVGSKASDLLSAPRLRRSKRHSLQPVPDRGL